MRLKGKNIPSVWLRCVCCLIGGQMMDKHNHAAFLVEYGPRIKKMLFIFFAQEIYSESFKFEDGT